MTLSSALVRADSNAHYWGAIVRADPSVHLVIHGTFPAARYASVQAYTFLGALLAGLDDAQFPADPGATNPFTSGGQRGNGSYTVHVVFGPLPPAPAPATLYVNRPPGTTVWLVYRLYLPDSGATTAGNVPLPLVTALDDTGGQVSCPLPSATMHGAPMHMHAWPALPSRRWRGAATWPRQLQGSGPVFARVRTTVVFDNADAAYLSASLATGPELYVIRFLTPTTPHTLAGEPFDPATQLRYWSLCVYPSTATSPSQCVADEQAPTDAQNGVTFVLGPAGAQPANATAANGDTWIALPARQPTTLWLRNLLPAAQFTQSAFAVPPYAAAGPATMGRYAPVTLTCTTAQFEANSCSG